MSSKSCHRCGVEPRLDYPSRPGFAYCASCSKEVQREALQKRRQYTDQIKLERGCEVCGYNAHPAALTFDHLDPAQKSFYIGSQKRVSKARLDAEIAKCRVICANCHNIHTHEQQVQSRSLHHRSH